MNTISENIDKIKHEINSENTTIIAVSKYVGVSEMQSAYAAGITHFGEAKAKDAFAKRNLLPKDVEENITWHFIGHLQSNKVNKVVGSYEYIHSVDSLKLAEQINSRANALGIQQKILLQVNITKEETKYGFKEEEIKEVYSKVSQLKNLSAIGLMTMAKHSEDEIDIRNTFKELRQIKENIKKTFNYELSELSMGMSNDYKIAAEEGSTMVRVGTKIFKID